MVPPEQLEPPLPVINTLHSVVLGPAAKRVDGVLQAAHEAAKGRKSNRVTCTSDGDALKAVSRGPVDVSVN